MADRQKPLHRRPAEYNRDHRALSNKQIADKSLQGGLAFFARIHEDGAAGKGGLVVGIGRQKMALLMAGLALTLTAAGCGRPAVRSDVPAASPTVHVPEKAQAPEKRELPRLGYTIQAGAFANAENAARLTRSLQARGLDATYFVARKGLYKVRFGNFPTREAARTRAVELRDAGIVEEFYVVSPEEYAAARRQARGDAYFREELVRTARSFLGVPYLWGGSAAETGFDCSGLTMTVYQLNGMDLPRTSQDQFAAGSPVSRSELAKGDLIFFAGTGDKISHVGVYAGDGLFIHAPGRGKSIRTDSLEKGYFSRTYVGARSYL
jgi:cell wall-associated NlpC family hydrolase